MLVLRTIKNKIQLSIGQALHREMRWQGESGLDPYIIFDLQWYENIKKDEPEIDWIMDEIFSCYWNTMAGKME